MEGTKFVRGGGENTVVIRCDVPEGRKAAAVDERIDVKARDTTRVVGRHFYVDVAWMATTIDPVNFLTVKGDANGASCLSGQQSGAHLVREGI